MLTDIDPMAPVQGEQRRHLYHTVQDVWEVHTNLAAWPRWQGDIAHAAPNEHLREGLCFTWSFKGAPPATAVVHVCERERLIVWESEGAGGRRVQRWTFEPADHGVLVIAAESQSGPAPFIIRSDKEGEHDWTTDDPAVAAWHLDRTLSKWLNFLASETGAYRDRQWSR